MLPAHAMISPAALCRACLVLHLHESQLEPLYGGFPNRIVGQRGALRAAHDRSQPYLTYQEGDMGDKQILKHCQTSCPTSPHAPIPRTGPNLCPDSSKHQHTHRISETADQEAAKNASEFQKMLTTSLNQSSGHFMRGIKWPFPVDNGLFQQAFLPEHVHSHTSAAFATAPSASSPAGPRSRRHFRSQSANLANLHNR